MYRKVGNRVIYFFNAVLVINLQLSISKYEKIMYIFTQKICIYDINTISLIQTQIYYK